ncbi:cell wall-binding repeat-containing protein [Clostridium sp. OS1-26]|uniref:cell wall-binding repeat-containing protein n=1 Tax=Clostridium sp. OS1-26 TaxID=3070681 RepID=UPI0027E1F6B4|nr:cell wall-binding repeat-containing protein [Clostridium sp. OS1-26]WML33092.1 cell wall-binding repeat-containing protein [Clostridium sp. OS1-26]
MINKKSAIMFSVVSLMVLAMSNIKVSAQGTSNRLWGTDRYETSSQICSNGWTKSEYAVIASGENFPDALGAASLAKKYNAPILLTEKNGLNENTSNQLAKLGVKHAFIVGGPGVVSSTVESQIKSKGIAVDRFYGADRYETSISIAKQMGNTSEVAVVTGEDFSDGLSIGPIAAKKGIPVILVPKTNLPAVIKNYISDKNISKTYIIGENDMISDEVAAQFPNVERITGSNRYDRNINIINRFEDDINFDKVCIASGENFPDALSGTAYAALNSSPIFLVSSNLNANAKTFISSKLAKINTVNILGGEAVVSQSILNNITNSSVNIPKSPTTEDDSANIQEDGIDLNNPTLNNSTNTDGTEYNLNDSELK